MIRNFYFVEIFTVMSHFKQSSSSRCFFSTLSIYFISEVLLFACKNDERLDILLIVVVVIIVKMI